MVNLDLRQEILIPLLAGASCASQRWKQINYIILLTLFQSYLCIPALQVVSDSQLCHVLYIFINGYKSTLQAVCDYPNFDIFLELWSRLVQIAHNLHGLQACSLTSSGASGDRCNHIEIAWYFIPTHVDSRRITVKLCTAK